MANKFLFLAAMILFIVATGADDPSPTRCAQVFQKVTNCLSFATGKAATPSVDCCRAVTDVRATDPACLCFIIQQVHNGSNEAVKSMGLQESRLLQLPSACRVVNATVADCPRLLNLPPNSPDAAIFTNASATTAPVTSSPGSSSSSSTANRAGLPRNPQIGGTITVLVAILFTALPSSILS